MAIGNKLPRLSPLVFTIPMVGNVLNCHNSVVLSVLWESRTFQPTLQDLTGLPMGSPAIIKLMLPYGTQMSRPRFFGQVALEPDSVVVFVKASGDPGHSCVALDAHRIGGYNQLDWFSRPGLQNQYTEHNAREFVWKSKGKSVKAGSGGHEHTIISVPAAEALKVLRQVLLVGRSR